MDENLIGNILGSLINRDNDCGMGGGNGAWWIIILLLFFTGGFGGFGMNRGMAAPATQQDVAAGFNFNQLDNGIRGLERGMCQLGYDNLAQTNGINMNISAQGNNIQSAITQVGYQAQQCCCETNRNIDSLKAQMAEDTCKITTAIHNEAETTRALITANKMQDLRDKLAESDRALQSANYQLSQISQTNSIVSQLRPTPVPAYNVCHPYTQSYAQPYCQTGTTFA